jgi:DNA-binding MarR family transcriptional regulator
MKKAAAMREEAASIDAAAARTQVNLASLERRIGYLARLAQLAIFQDFIASLAELNLRPAQYSALVAIRDNPGRRQSEIAAALAIKRANFVALMDELERRGLAARRDAASDRRSHALYLTEAGERLLGRADRLVEQQEERLTDRLGGAAKRDQLAALLRRLIAP